MKEDDVSNLITKTGLTENVIRSWFRVSRALANVFDADEVDKEEMVSLKSFEDIVIMDFYFQFTEKSFVDYTGCP